MPLCRMHLAFIVFYYLDLLISLLLFWIVCQVDVTLLPFSALQALFSPSTSEDVRCRHLVHLRLTVSKLSQTRIPLDSVLEFNQLKNLYSSCGSCLHLCFWTDFLRPFAFPFPLKEVGILCVYLCPVVSLSTPILCCTNV
jgi:hypothetical protein